jgi:PPOX class probable F420-dependent enzyme
MPALSEAEALRRLGAQPVARLATIRPDGTPRLVPFTFVLVDGLIWSAIDDVKPKRSTRLARLRDVERDPRVAVLADHYAADWAELWWVRIDGKASLAEGPADALRAKYPGYRDAALADPLLCIRPGSITGWSAVL